MGVSWKRKVTLRRFFPPQSIDCNYFTGVPDSLLKDFCAYVTAKVPSDQHVIAANEGTAVALAAGHHIATKKFPLVYLQNSGLGNIVNPIMSLCHPDVYRFVTKRCTFLWPFASAVIVL
jgi:sulfopyruvate decarboxylase TPP-binding subunit